MRNKKRIKIYRDIILSQWDEFKEKGGLHESISKKDFKAFCKVWKDNCPDQRLFQALDNSEMLMYNYGFWSIEGNRWLASNLSVNYQDLLLWGTRYNERAELLPKTKFILIRNMSKSHISNILRDVASGKMVKPNKLYLKTMIDRFYDIN